MWEHQEYEQDDGTTFPGGSAMLQSLRYGWEHTSMPVSGFMAVAVDDSERIAYRHRHATRYRRTREPPATMQLASGSAAESPRKLTLSSS